MGDYLKKSNCFYPGGKNVSLIVRIPSRNLPAVATMKTMPSSYMFKPLFTTSMMFLVRRHLTVSRMNRLNQHQKFLTKTALLKDLSNVTVIFEATFVR